MWVFINGLDGGIFRIVGDVIYNEYERRLILLFRVNIAYGKIVNFVYVEELIKLTVIGIVSKSIFFYGKDIVIIVSKYCVLR